jgi:hypothetical protein
MIKPENYIQIQGWMVTDLKLSGNELMTYALIYGFTQDGSSKFTGSLNYVCHWLNCTKPTALKALHGLAEKNLIVKDDSEINGVKFCKYYTPIKESCIPIKESLTEGIKDSLPNNTIINNTNNNNSFLQKKINSVEELITNEQREKYGDKLITKFINYWNEPIGNKLRFQKQHTFQINGRLAKWAIDSGDLPILYLHNKLIQDKDKMKAFAMLYPKLNFEIEVKKFYVETKIGREPTSYADYVNHFFNKLKIK